MKLAPFTVARYYFRLPLEERLAHTNDFKRGFLKAVGRPNESYEISLDLPLEHPDVIAGHYLHGPNYWPDEQPWLREAGVKFVDMTLEVAEKLERLFKIEMICSSVSAVPAPLEA